MTASKELIAAIREELGADDATAGEAYWIAETVTGLTRSQLVAGAVTFDEEVVSRALDLARRRAAGEPLQYVTGVSAFRHLHLQVGPDVFIPRPETELVAERAMALLPQGGTVVDVGTGSGAIALAIAHERLDARVLATEASPRALAWAERNRDALAVGVELVRCDLLSRLDPSLRQSVDVVVSNPPYVAASERDRLPEDVVAHEPHDALFAGAGGMDVIERLAGESRDWLCADGWLVLEIGEDQGAAALEVLSRAGYEDARVERDLAGRDRVASARWGRDRPGGSP